jgi:ElaB/YqjD/DUF883 family membrane-anchored ribosome-binding protein
MSSSEQLERETEEERARISETLDELRARMTPGNVLDRLVDYATDSSGGMFFRNLRKQLVDNPLPVALVGTGLAWLAISARRGTSSGTNAGGILSRTTEKIGAAGDKLTEGVKHAADTASDAASKLSDRARSAANELGQHGQATASNLQDAARETPGVMTDKVSSGYGAASALAGDATSRVRDAAHSAIDTVGETASSAAYDAAADRARSTADTLQKSLSSVRVKAAAGGHSIMDFVSEQPLVVVGLGLAIGAAIGAASPSTETEDRLMGESSDALKKEAADLAKEQVTKVQGAAERAWQDATGEAENQDSALPSGGVTARGSRPEAATSERPLAPATEAPASRQDERGEC